MYAARYWATGSLERPEHTQAIFTCEQARGGVPQQALSADQRERDLAVGTGEGRSDGGRPSRHPFAA